MNNIPLKIVTRISVILLVLGFLLVTIGICIGNSLGLIVLILGLAILIGAIIFIAIFSRCPICGGFLKMGFRNHYCPHCGKYVDHND